MTAAALDITSVLQNVLSLPHAERSYLAERLIVSLNTVRFHVKSIYGKLGVDNRTAALEQARRRRLL